MGRQREEKETVPVERYKNKPEHGVFQDGEEKGLRV